MEHAPPPGSIEADLSRLQKDLRDIKRRQDLLRKRLTGIAPKPLTKAEDISGPNTSAVRVIDHS